MALSYAFTLEDTGSPHLGFDFQSIKALALLPPKMRLPPENQYNPMGVQELQGVGKARLTGTGHFTLGTTNGPRNLNYIGTGKNNSTWEMLKAKVLGNLAKQYFPYSSNTRFKAEG